MAKLQLKGIILVGKPLVETTYILEGDGPTSLVAYRLLKQVKLWFDEHMKDMSFPASGMQQLIDNHVSI
jgi:hypothetical protein